MFAIPNPSPSPLSGMQNAVLFLLLFTASAVRVVSTSLAVPRDCTLLFLAHTRSVANPHTHAHRTSSIYLTYAQRQAGYSSVPLAFATMPLPTAQDLSRLQHCFLSFVVTVRLPELQLCAHSVLALLTRF